MENIGARNAIAVETLDVCRVFRAGAPREVRAVDHVSIQVPCGSVVALAGPSGSGKTSLLSLMGLLDRPTSGAVMVAGIDYTRSSDYERARRRRRLGFVFQEFALLSKLSAADNVAYPLVPRGLGRKQRRQIAEQWLQRLGMAARAASRPEELSGGECQRVALARALAGDPEILLADEPTSNLDAETSRVVLDVLRAFSAQGRTLILSTHDEQVLAMATHVYEMHDGKLRQSAD